MGKTYAIITVERDVSDTFQKRLRRYTRDGRPGALQAEAENWYAESLRLRDVAQQVRSAASSSGSVTSSLAASAFQEECIRIADAAEQDADRAYTAAEAMQLSADSLANAQRAEDSLSEERRAHPHPGPQPGPGASGAEHVAWSKKFEAYEERRMVREGDAAMWVDDVNANNQRAQSMMVQVHQQPEYQPRVDWDELRRKELERLDDDPRQHREAGPHPVTGPVGAPADASGKGTTTNYAGTTQGPADGGPGAAAGTGSGASVTGAGPGAGAGSGTSTAAALGVGAGGVLGAGAAAAARASAGGTTPGAGVASAGGRAGARAVGRSTGAASGPGSMVANGGAGGAGGRSGSVRAGGRGVAPFGGGSHGTPGRRDRDDEDDDARRERLLLEESWLDDEQGGPATLGR